MKRLIILGAIGIALVAGIAIGQRTPRFELIYTESLEDIAFHVYHDKDTGQEIVCGRPYDSHTYSCYLTGRKWGTDRK